ncbi:MAG: UbiA family prenyltransferase [Deltaproteobacteria bacterium]|nr:UbiA family prenyltransferase [Deltaproteobacteria bacterium]
MTTGRFTVKPALSVARLHIVAIAAVATLTFGWVFTGRYLWSIAAVSALDWFLVNLLNRVTDQIEDQENEIVGAGFAARHTRAITVLGFSLLGGSFLGSLLLYPLTLSALRAAYHMLGLLYNWRLLPGRRRLKQMYLLKNTASATGFLLTVFGYPLAVAERLPTIGLDTVICSAAFFFLFELSYEVIYDLRDAPGDRRAGVHSFIVVHGERAAIWIIDGLLIGSLVTIGAGYALKVLPWKIFIMFAAPLIQLAAYKTALRRKAISSAFCVNITWIGAALLIIYHFWYLFGLPGAYLQ